MSSRPSKTKRTNGVVAAALGALVPGLGHGYAGYWKRAAVVALPTFAIAVATVALSRMGTFELLGFGLRPTVLRSLVVVNVALVLWRVFAVADPFRLSRTAKGLGSAMVVGVLAVAVALPHVVLVKYALDTASALEAVFVVSDQPPDVTVRLQEVTVSVSGPDDDSVTIEVADPASAPARDAAIEPISTRNLVFRQGFGDPDAIKHSIEYRQSEVGSLATLIGDEVDDVERITFLLAGGDGGPGRGGSRTDAIMVASIDTSTGKAAVFGIPRNMTHVELPDAWATAFVDLEKRLIPWDERKLWTDDDGDGEPDQFESCRCFPDQINAIYPYTRAWVDTYPDEVDPGLAALRDTLEIMLGIDIDYYAMVNMSGFVRLVDALGGIRTYVTGSVQTEVSPAREGEDWITIDLKPGWQKLSGHSALAYVRERRSVSDYTRMKRQRCLLKAVAAKMDPATVITRFSAISKAVASSVRTDIDVEFLPVLMRHASNLDFADMVTVGFVPPDYAPISDHRGKPTPDVDRIQEMVQWAFHADEATTFDTGSDSECRI